MPTRRKKPLLKMPRKRSSKRSTTDRFPLIEKALKKRTKADLVKLVVKLAKSNATLSRDLESALDVRKPVDLLISDVESAICRATDFDERDANHNFDYDYGAYEDVKKGFKELIALGSLEEVKELAIRLMKDGSYQVECSDEGMMTDDIEDCLKPVIRAVKSDGGDSASKWAFAMLLEDRVGFLCEKQLKAMAGQA